MIKNNELFNAIVALSKGKENTLSKELIEIDERSKNELKQLGVNETSQFTFKRSAVKMGTEVENFQYADNRKSKILDRCFRISDLKNSVNVPFVNDLNTKWIPEGQSSRSYPSIYNHLFSPYRISTYVKIPKIYLTQNQKFRSQFSEMLFQSLENKLIETIFSDSHLSTHPDGIFYNKQVSTISEITDIFDEQYTLDKEKGNNSFVVSPFAKYSLFNMTGDYKLFNDSKLFGSDYSLENMCQDGFMTYLDLSKLYVLDWETYGIDVDGISDIHNGNIVFYLNGYYDFAYLGEMKLMKFVGSGSGSGSGSGNGE